MSDHPQEQQLHNEPASVDEVMEEQFTLEDIIREFGGWSKREPEPEPELPQEEAVEEELSEQPSDETDEEEVLTVREEKPTETAEQPPVGAVGDTIRFAPIREEEKPEEAEQQIWTYKGEPVPEGSTDEENAADIRRAERAEERRRKRIERARRRRQWLEARKLQRAEQPEHTYVSAQEAYQAYCKKTTLRTRLLGSFALTIGSAVLLLLASQILVGVDLSGFRMVFSIALIVIMLLQAVLAYDTCLRGVQKALQLRLDHEGMLVLALVTSLIDSVFALVEGRLPFCTVVSLGLTISLWGEYMKLHAKRRTLKTVCAMSSPVAAVREEKAWHGKDCIFRAEADADAFAVQLEMPDASRRVMRVYAPLVCVLSFVFAVLGSVQTGQGLFRNWTALLMAAYPMGALICFARPFSVFARRLMRTGTAVAGWHGARNLSGECGIVVEDADLFPSASVTLNGMKIYSDRPLAQIASFATAVVEAAGSGLVPLFRQILESQNGRKTTVDAFRRYEGGGLGAEIRGDVILMGSLAFMKLMRVQMPEGTRLKQAVYLSVNSELAAVFALNYAPVSSVKNSLLSAAHTNGLFPVLATRDFMITPQFLKHRYKLMPDRVEFPTVEERAWLSSPEAIREPKQGAIMARGSFANFVQTVTAARALRAASMGSLLISILGGVLGLLMLFFLTFIGAAQAVSAWNLLIFSVLWLIPQLLLTTVTSAM